MMRTKRHILASVKFSFIFVLMLLVGFTGCEKPVDKTVEYKASGSVSPVSLTYRNEAGDLISTTFQATSVEDEWRYIFEAKQGSIIYLSAIYKDITSSVTLSLLIDGKTYKQASSEYDTLNYVIVSGTIPY
jgi:hypothetical protein